MNQCHNETAAEMSHDHSHMMGHGSARDFLRRFWIVTFLLIPLFLTNETITELVGLPTLTLGTYIQFGISVIIFGFGLVFFQHAWHEIKMRQYGMMTLVSLAVLAGFGFSFIGTFVPAIEESFYLEISTLIWVLLFGHYLEAKSGAAAGDALSEVAKLLPKEAHVVEGGEERDVPITELQQNMLVRVKPGEKVPVDGVVIEGASQVNESLISGESKPIEKNEESKVVAGSIVIDGTLLVRVTETGENSTIGQIQKLITEAQSTKPSSQRLADKAAKVLTFTAGTVALLTLVVWAFIIGQPFVFAFTLAITVLVIACPHALGLAIPTVTTIATRLSVKHGIFIKDLSKLEVLKNTDYVFFDKTGTLTKGEFGIEDIVVLDEKHNKEKMLRIAASLEQSSSHIIGVSIVKHAKEQELDVVSPQNFKNHAGKGVSGTVGDIRYIVGNEKLMREQGVWNEEVGNKYDRYVAKGKTVIVVASKEKVVGFLVLGDAIKEEAQEAVARLHSMGVKVAMITGDNKAVADAVAEELSIDEVFAEVLPEDKYRHVKDLQEKGNVVVMVGDGVNDAPALTQADVGVAIGAGTDVAVEAGSVVLTESNPEAVARLLKLARKTYSKMIQNLWWALGYNVVAIPAAAGVFVPLGFVMRPEVGALLMGFSTVIVVINALTLRKVDLS